MDTQTGKRLKSVFFFENGNVAVCDETGRQIPELQGRFSEVAERVEAAADDQTEWYGWPEPPCGIVKAPFA
jgi:hypothetical protein